MAHPDHDTSTEDSLVAGLQSCCAPGEWATLRAGIAEHEQRLQNLSPAARDATVVDALLSDATTNPSLAAALQHMAHHGVARHQARVPQN